MEARGICTTVHPHSTRPAGQRPCVEAVDFELWAAWSTAARYSRRCSKLLFGVAPLEQRDKVCMECKRQHATCVMVNRGPTVSGTGHAYRLRCPVPTFRA